MRGLAGGLGGLAATTLLDFGSTHDEQRRLGAMGLSGIDAQQG